MKRRQMSVDLLVPGDVIAPDSGGAQTVLAIEDVAYWDLKSVTLGDEQGGIWTTGLPYEMLVTVLIRQGASQNRGAE